MKIIFLGHCSYYTIANFTEALKKNNPDTLVTVVNPIKPGGDKITDDELSMFDGVIDFPQKRNVKLSGKNKSDSLINILSNGKMRRVMLKNIILLRFKSVINQIKSNAEENIYTGIVRKLLSDFDIYHYHYLDPLFLTTIKYIPAGKKILLTFWGSDLFQISGVDNYKKQLKALNRADLITVNSIELKETVLSKFGRNFYNKIEFADFGLNRGKLDLIDNKDKDETLLKFKRMYNIPEDKIIITIGYSGSSKQRHIEILKLLDQVDTKIKEKIFAVIPMTYGLQFEKENYLQKVKEVCKELGFGSYIIENYMVKDELAEFIISSEIKLNLRDTDAMNAAMLESLYAGNIVINGAWLPYGKLRRVGAYYHEIAELEDLKGIITYILDNIESEKSRASVNKNVIWKNFLCDNIVGDWTKIYKKLLNHQIKNQDGAEVIKI